MLLTPVQQKHKNANFSSEKYRFRLTEMKSNTLKIYKHRQNMMVDKNKFPRINS